MNITSRIYVAGHRGLVGSALVRKLLARGYDNLVLKTHAELDLRRQADVEAFFASERPEYVFLAAAKVGGIVANNTYKADFIADNLAIALNVIHASYKHGAKKLMNFGSSCIYPRLAPQPLTEDALLTGPLEPTNEPYAIAKIAAIKLCRYYNEQYGTDFLSVMPTNLYGVNDNFNLETSHVLPALIRKFSIARLLRDDNLAALKDDVRRFAVGFGIEPNALNSDMEATKAVFERLGITADSVTLWGTGEPYREFLYADDLADASVFLMERYGYRDVGEFINIGTGSDVTIKEIATVVQRVVGFEGSIGFDPSKPSGTPRKLLNVSRLEKLGWKAQIPLEEGIRRTVEWYRAERRMAANVPAR
jgi:GDP-L-fucose synthase